MKAGSAISSTATLNNLLGDAGKRSAQMPVRFENHETSHTLGKRKSSAATNNAPKSTTFYHHDAEAHASNTTKKNRNTEKVLPLSQSQRTPPPIPIITSNEQTNMSQALPEEPDPVVPLSRNIDCSQAASSGTAGDVNKCPICKTDVIDRGVECDMCSCWVHQTCLHMSDEEYLVLTQSDNETKWFCSRCRLIKSNKLKWGELCGEETIQAMVKSAYETIIGWRKNIFRLPRGKCGNDFIKELRG